MSKFLIVDDEPITHIVISKMIDMMDHEIIGKTSSKSDGVEAAIKLKPDYVLMDISLHYSFDGIDACREIKENSAETKVIFISGHPEHSLKTELKNIMYDGYLEKPFTVSKLSTIIHNC